MILRKPYAFLIRHFKFIHLIMTICMAFLIYQTNILADFFNSAISSSQIITNNESLNMIIGGYIYLLDIIVIIMSIIILILMSFKDKPKLYYILTLFGYIGLFILYVYSGTIIDSLMKGPVDERIVRAVRDFLNIGFIFQLYTITVSFIRMIGLDIKKFDFKVDIEDLGLKDEDNEEFELNIEFDSHTLRRNAKRNYRNLKYYFLENKVILTIVLIFILIGIAIFIFSNIGSNTKKYQMNQPVAIMNYNVVVNSAYITKTNYRIKPIVPKDTSLVVVKLKAKSLYSVDKLIFGKMALQIGDNKYYHNIKYFGSLDDLGVVYTNQDLTKDYQDFILVYEVPDIELGKTKKIVYTEKLDKGIFSDRKSTKEITLSTIDLDINKDINEVNLYQRYMVGNGLLEGYELKLNSLDIKSRFNIDYDVCITEDECYKYYEVLQPSLTGISDKAILKINMDIQVPENGKYKNLEKIITNFGSIKYLINGNIREQTISKVITPIHKDNYFYFETSDEVLKADSLSLMINARNDKYQFKID